MTKRLDDFWHYGYFPQYSAAEVFTQYLRDALSNKDDIASLTEAELIHLGTKILQATVPTTLRGDQVISLSGGRASRALLGLVLEHVSSNQVNTFTFGTPGTRDYEIGNRVARSVGTKHVSIDLSKHKVLFEDLVEIASKKPLNTIINTYYNNLVYAHYGDTANYWSGFLGDPVAGSHMVDVINWKDACQQFSQKNQFAQSIRLSDIGYDPMVSLPAEPFLSENLMPYYEQLDFVIRQHLHVRSIVTNDDYTVMTPFSDKTWIGFMYSLPQAMRSELYLYRKILMCAFPKLFRMPTKSDHGLRVDAGTTHRKIQKIIQRTRWRLRKPKVNILLNYIDFGEAFIYRDDLRTVIETALEIVSKQSKIATPDFTEIWNIHQQGKIDRASALRQMVALAAHIEAQI